MDQAARECSTRSGALPQNNCLRDDPDGILDLDIKVINRSVETLHERRRQDEADRLGIGSLRFQIWISRKRTGTLRRGALERARCAEHCKLRSGQACVRALRRIVEVCARRTAAGERARISTTPEPLRLRRKQFHNVGRTNCTLE